MCVKGVSCRSGSVNETSRVDSQKAVQVVHKYAFPDLFSFQAVTAPYPRVRGADRGRSEVDGSDPPFCCPDRARRRCANHICATPPGRVAPVQNIPGGKAINDARGVAESSLMSARNGNLERSLHRAAKVLRSQRTYYCPHCGGYQGHRSPCPRCGDKCEPIPAKRKKP